VDSLQSARPVPLARAPLDVFAVVRDLLELALDVALRLVVEVRRRGVAALSASEQAHGAYTRAELDHGDEAVAAGAEDALGRLLGARAEGGERAPVSGGHGHRQAGPLVVEARVDGAVKPLEAVDLSPRCVPAAEVGGDALDGS
jgi:hypothetical protein